MVDVKVTKERPGVTVGTPDGKQKLSYLETNTLVLKVDGLDTFLNFLESDMPVPQRTGDSDDRGSSDFNAFYSYAEAMDTFRNHPETVIKFDPAEFRIKDDKESGQRVDYDVVGDYIDMGRYLEDIPETWGEMHLGNARNRRVNILINVTQVWSVDQKDIVHRGERILRLVDALEAGGVRTMITAVESSQCAHTEVIIKRHDEPLSITDLAVVSHPEYLRRLIFRVVEYSDTFEVGYGNAVCFDEAINSDPTIIRTESNDEMNIYIGSNMRGRYIDEQFDKLEKLLVWEMNKTVPEVDAVKIDSGGIKFSPNGMRSSEEIILEGNKVMEEEL